MRRAAQGGRTWRAGAVYCQEGMETFFKSVGQAFLENRAALPGVELGLLVLLALVGAWHLLSAVRRRWGRRARFRAMASARGLSREDARWATALARQAGVLPLQILTHLDLFEKATADALQSGPEGTSARVRRIRQALGFDRLAAHTPLLSTRELQPGTALTVLDRPGTIAEVDEKAFGVELAEPPAAPPGQPLALVLVHAREARYQLACRLVAAHPSPGGGWRATFQHDEAPQRVQQREYARVRAEGIAVLHPLSGWEGLPQRDADVATRLIDVSGGGLQLVTRVRLPAGLLAQVALQLGGERFEALRAVVLASAPAGDGWRAHLEFSGQPGGERERLAAAVTRAELQRRASDRQSA